MDLDVYIRINKPSRPHTRIMDRKLKKHNSDTSTIPSVQTRSAARAADLASTADLPQKSSSRRSSGYYYQTVVETTEIKKEETDDTDGMPELSAVPAYTEDEISTNADDQVKVKKESEETDIHQIPEYNARSG